LENRPVQDKLWFEKGREGALVSQQFKGGKFGVTTKGSPKEGSNLKDKNRTLTKKRGGN